MARKRAETEPELIVDKHIDERTGVTLKRTRRGVLESVSASVTGDRLFEFLGGSFVDGKPVLPEHESYTAYFIRIREEFCNYLESISIPTCRTPEFVRIDDSAWRPRTSIDTVDLLKAHKNWGFADWYSVAMEKTEPLSKARLCVDHLRYIDKALKTFNEEQLSVAIGLAKTYLPYMIAIGGLGQFAHEYMKRAQAETDAGRRSAKTRAAKAERWRQGVLTLAKTLRVEQPELSQGALASEIEARWKDASIDLPSHRRIERFVGEMEKAGELAPKTKKPVATAREGVQDGM